jgi:tetratricopeptide (TPR) repeat protein
MSFGENATTTIGRDAELRLVDDALSSYANRTSNSILFSGEPGIGKSHLLREIAQRGRARSLRVIALRCLQSDTAETFALFRRLGTILEISEPSALDTDTARFHHGRDIVDEATKVPTLIVIDDLQWCDYLSSIAIVQLFDYCSASGLGLIFSTRPIDKTEDERAIPNLRTLSRLMNHVPLPGLTRSELSLMADRETENGLQPSKVDFLLRLTNGNPFFVLEMLRSNNTSESLLQVAVPREVETILDQRINLLEDQEEIIAVAALLGVQGERRILSQVLALLGFNDTKVTAVLQQAQHLDLLSLSLTTYEFRHALYTHRLISRMSFLRRCSFHSVIARTLFHESQFLSGLTHLVAAGSSIDLEFGVPLAKIAFELSKANNDHAGITDAGTWLLEFGPTDNASRIQTLITLSQAQLEIGHRSESRRNAQLAAELSRSEGDVESEAMAIMKWAARSDFTPDRAPIIAAFENLDLSSLNIETRVSVLSSYAIAVTMIPTDEYVSVSSATRLMSALGDQFAGDLNDEKSHSAAWNWTNQSGLGRQLSQRAVDELETNLEHRISDDNEVKAWLAWRQAHRAPEFLAQRLQVTNRLMTLVNDESPQVESVRFSHILDLLESGEYSKADLELAFFLNSSQFGGSFIAQWRSEFIRAGRLLSQGRLGEARESSVRAHERGAIADEPGRLIVLLEQQAFVLIESIIPPEYSEVFSGESMVLSNHYALVTAALANAALGNFPLAEKHVKDAVEILSDTDREAAWLPTVATLVETAHLLGLFDIASQAVALLEPFVKLQATFIGSISRGPIRRYAGLAKHAAGNTQAAIDDILLARNETRRSGEHLWSLACSVDILEILATTDPQRALQLVPEDIIIDAEASEMKWRATRGRAALSRARNTLALQLGLTERQWLVLQGLCTNSTINEIADTLGFSHSTVRQDSIVIYRILGISGRIHIADRARELMLL